MQCTWFLQEGGDAALRAGKLPLAVKRYERIISIFKDEDDDQYDFHTYALRKMNSNAYFNMVEFGKQFRHHPRYRQAAAQAADIYLRIYDNPDLREVKLSPEEEAERKKAAKKAQKANSKAKKAAAAPSENKEEPALPDADPEGKEYLKEVDALAAIERLLQPLFSTAEDEITLWLTSFELALRQGLCPILRMCQCGTKPGFRVLRSLTPSCQSAEQVLQARTQKSSRAQSSGATRFEK
jgi:peptide alpha-N-acetyltransferase